MRNKSTGKFNENSKERTAIKLANQYAEYYQQVENENKILKKEIEDKKTTIEINKTILADILNTSIKPAQKERLIIEGLKKENVLLNNTISYYSKENEDLKRRILNNPSYSEINMNKMQKQIESLNNKIFLLENAILKKDNMIKQQKKKLDELVYTKDNEDRDLIRETYVSLMSFKLFLI